MFLLGLRNKQRISRQPQLNIVNEGENYLFILLRNVLAISNYPLPPGFILV